MLLYFRRSIPARLEYEADLNPEAMLTDKCVQEYLGHSAAKECMAWAARVHTGAVAALEAARPFVP
jgi:hypothetical protein